jgi:hypothetical protein
MRERHALMPMTCCWTSQRVAAGHSAKLKRKSGTGVRMGTKPWWFAAGLAVAVASPAVWAVEDPSIACFAAMPDNSGLWCKKSADPFGYAWVLMSTGLQ